MSAGLQTDVGAYCIGSATHNKVRLKNYWKAALNSSLDRTETPELIPKAEKEIQVLWNNVIPTRKLTTSSTLILSRDKSQNLTMEQDEANEVEISIRPIPSDTKESLSNLVVAHASDEAGALPVLFDSLIAAPLQVEKTKTYVPVYSE